MKRFLLYFDGLPASQRALELAETLTKTEGAHLVLLYIRSRHLLPAPIHPLQGPPTMTEADRPILSVPEPAREEEMRQSLTILEKAREQLEGKGVQADYLIAEGDIVEEVVKEAAKSYDLLICPVALKAAESTLDSSALQKFAARLSCSIFLVR